MELTEELTSYSYAFQPATEQIPRSCTRVYFLAHAGTKFCLSREARVREQLAPDHYTNIFLSYWINIKFVQGKVKIMYYTEQTWAHKQQIRLIMWKEHITV